MNRYRARLAILGALTSISLIVAYDGPHFYRATNLFFEPRIDRDYLTSVDFFFQGGATSEAHNSCENIVPLIDIYGYNNMHDIGVGVPCKDLSNPLDMIITQLALTPSRCETSIDASKTQSIFANFSIGGKFQTLEGIFSFMQNFKRGFYFQLYFPIRKLAITNLCYVDISPTSEPCPNIDTPIWQIFKNNFDAILARYDLSRKPVSGTNLGDMTFLLGWTHSFQSTRILDFVDTTIKLGWLIPSGEQRCVDLVYSLPFGYDGHMAAVLEADLSLGLFDWLTLGGEFNAMVFANKTKEYRMKTALAQSGWFKLAKGQATSEKGAIWQIGTYIKADHFVRGLSLLLGYSFVQENDECLNPCDTDIFCPSIVNSDTSLLGWKMSTINLWFEYDFATDRSVIGPRVAFYYNWVVGGKRIFLTNIGGGNLGMDIRWDF